MPQAQWESTRRCTRTAEISTEIAKLKKKHHLGGFRDNTGDFTLIFGRKIRYCLGIYLFPILIYFFLSGKMTLGVAQSPQK